MSAGTLELLTSDEVANVFRVNPATIRQWARENIIRGYQSRRRGEYRFVLDEVREDLLKRNAIVTVNG